MTNLAELTTPHIPNWCPGCGNFGIWAAFKNAAVKEGWDNSNTTIVAGIGCHGHIINFVKISAFEGLHGRALPVAEGLKMVHSRLNVFAFTGDGDCLSEGGNHFIHGCRRNHNITVLLHNNDVYGLTIGQCSPTSPLEFVTGSTPGGNRDEPFNVLGLALASGATFVARGSSGDIEGLSQLITEANRHQGISVVEILQPCTTFDKIHTHAYWKENTFQLPATHDRQNWTEAMTKIREVADKKINLGIFYQIQKPVAEIDYPENIVETEVIKRDVGQILAKFA